MLSHGDVSTNVVNHKPGCPVQRLRVRQGRGTGVYVATCPKCKAGALVDETGTPLERPPHRRLKTAVVDRSTSTTPTTKFRCPVHDTPVTWRGTGCEPCQNDRDTYRARRIQRRAAALTDTYQEGI